LLLSQTANVIGEPADLSRNDFTYAAGLHVLVFVVLIALSIWHPHTLPQPPKNIQVLLISPSQLQKYKPAKTINKPRPKAKPKPKPKAKPKPKPKAKPKPKSKPKPKVKPKPKAKMKLKPKAKIKPRLKKKMAAKPKTRSRSAKAKNEKHFDPFQPLVSTRKAQTPNIRKDLTETYLGQLSRKEIDLYILKIQGAVLQHWKVPANSHVMQDPEVQMELNRDGSVRKVEISLSSGNAALDSSLLRAIRAAQPFSLPRNQFEVFRSNHIRFHPLH